MNKYECSKCKRVVVTNDSRDNLNLKCCSGETPVAFKKLGTSIIVPVAKLPAAMTAPKVPLPASTPAK